eukprot:674240-Prorocentrum_lima.AAC.1
MHDLYEESMYHCEQGRPGGATLFQTLERVDHRAGGPRMQVDVLMVGAQKSNDVRRDTSA